MPYLEEIRYYLATTKCFFSKDYTGFVRINLGLRVEKISTFSILGTGEEANVTVVTLRDKLVSLQSRAEILLFSALTSVLQDLSSTIAK